MLSFILYFFNAQVTVKRSPQIVTISPETKNSQDEVNIEPMETN